MVASQKPWADGPFPLVSNAKLKLKDGETAQGAKEMAMEMIIVHNTLLRIINSIYLQCINVGVRGTQQDIDDFVQYARLWHKGVTHHHHTEETMIFPDIERMAGVPGLMEANVAQHEAFHDGMESYKTYLDRVSAGEEKYDGLKFKQIIDSFADVLHQHLTDEIDTLVKLHEEHADKAEWGVWYKKTMEEILKATKDPEHATTVVPLIFTNHEKEFENGVSASRPPLPWFAMLIVKWWFIPTNKQWWRFSACDANMKRRELPFV
ncbi:hypothetical protein HYQ44_007540 [Verticillium longisporum]|nr:hypothetical protein HYQ44_007540 [Verticillium longisporum]